MQGKAVLALALVAVLMGVATSRAEGARLFASGNEGLVVYDEVPAAGAHRPPPALRGRLTPVRGR